MWDVLGKPLESKTGKIFEKMRFYSKEWFHALYDGERPMWEVWVLLCIPVVFIINNGESIIRANFKGLALALVGGLFDCFSVLALFFSFYSMYECAKNYQNPLLFYLFRIIASMGFLMTFVLMMELTGG